MKTLFDKLTMNRKLAIMVFVIGFFAIFAGSPYKGHTVTIDTQKLAMIVEQEVDHVDVNELADWIIKGNENFRLLDLRGGFDYNEYHIPLAENVSITGLNEYPIMRNEKIILYSEGGIHSAQAWFLLKAMDFKGVYLLTGGMDEWKDEILFPVIPEVMTEEEKEIFDKKKEVSKYFGGMPQVAGIETKESSPQLSVPKLEMPTQVRTAPAQRKRKEGC